MSTMHINLEDISESGKTFDFKMAGDKELDTELASAVDDLKTYAVHLHISKAGDIYLAQGNFVLEKQDQCSLCGEDISANLETKFTEYLVIEDRSQSGHAPHSGLNYETTKETYFLESTDFDVFEFIREIMTSSVPLYPKCEDTVQCAENRKVAEEKLKSQTLQGHPGFSVLSKLKKH
jgi:uncharacterized metal-binding protein YceD (DUF177 family)